MGDKLQYTVLQYTHTYESIISTDAPMHPMYPMYLDLGLVAAIYNLPDLAKKTHVNW